MLTRCHMSTTSYLLCLHPASLLDYSLISCLLEFRLSPVLLQSLSKSFVSTLSHNYSLLLALLTSSEFTRPAIAIFTGFYREVRLSANVNKICSECYLSYNFYKVICDNNFHIFCTESVPAEGGGRRGGGQSREQRGEGREHLRYKR